MHSQAPVQAKSPVGQMVRYYLQMEPHLFEEAVRQQLEQLRAEREDKARAEQEKQAEPQPAAADQGNVVLYRRMEELRQNEQRATVMDLMYAIVLSKFIDQGVSMLPRLEEPAPKAPNLKALTESIYSKDAIDMIREHVLGVLGPATMAYDNAMLKMSKLQAAQVYAASIMFGYFVGRVDKRFQLERSMGILIDKEDAVERLRRMFEQGGEFDAADDPDRVPGASSGSAGSGETSGDAGDSSALSVSQQQQPRSQPQQPGSQPQQPAASQPPQRKKPSALRQYIERFDQGTLREMAALVSAEGAQLVETQTHALFGDLTALQRQMGEAVGQDSTSMDELMQRVQEAVASNKVETLSITVGTQRRAVLEAVVFGTFLRDVESHVDEEYGLLTKNIPSSGGGGAGRGGAGGGRGGGDGSGRRGGGGPVVGV